MTRFIVWYSIPAVAGSFKLRIAEWAPAVAGLILTTRFTGVFLGSAIDVALVEHVPSLPTQLRLYLVVPPAPLVRRNVYVRLYLSPTSTPSRSWIPTPTPGVARKSLSSVCTWTEDEISAVGMFVRRTFHAASTSIRPLPWS